MFNRVDFRDLFIDYIAVSLVESPSSRLTGLWLYCILSARLVRFSSLPLPDRL